MSFIDILFLSLQDIRITSYYKVGSNKFRLFKALFAPSFICISIYRTSHLCYLLKIPLIPKIFWWMNFLLFKVDIDYRSKIYAGIYMPHPISIVIGEGVKILGFLKIMQGVTIGGNLNKDRIFEGKLMMQPSIKGNIFLGIGVIIAGPVIIEGTFFVTANSLITKDLKGKALYSNGFIKSLENEYLSEIYK